MKVCILLLLVSSQLCFAQNADINLLKDINVNRNKNFDQTFTSITHSSYYVSLTVPTAMIGTGFIKKDSLLKWNGLQVGTAVIFSVLVTRGLKYSINRTRPYEKYDFIQNVVAENTPSFPSGHTSSAFATATSVSMLYPKWYVIVPSYLWAGSVAYSRMHLGVHYPGDVLGGAIVGAGSSYLTYKANYWLQKRKKSKLKTN
ncbi:MAG: phosphatase PAP2 family protein [Daejeonella sp.]